jgi:papain fold toxin 2 of polymorphic toxin system
MTIERAQRLAAGIAAKYDVFDCDKCAKAIARRLGKDFQASFERLSIVGEGDIIGLAATDMQISKNGVHGGIRIGDIIVDNIHPEGIPADEWADLFIAEYDAPLAHESRSIREFFGMIFLAERFNRWLFRNRRTGA